MEVGLMRGIWSHISSDEGMTIVEIMIAAMILLIVLTALLPLVFETTKMTAQTQAQTIVNNYVNSFIEEIRAMPYEEVGLVGSASVPGSLEPTRSIVVEGYTVDLSIGVAWVDDAEMVGNKNYKEITVEAVLSAAGKPGARYSTVTYVWGGGATETGPLPNVSFSASSPSQNAVVQGNAITIGGRAQTPRESGTIVRMSLKVDSDFLPDSASPPNFAEFTTADNPANVSWFWDTEARVALLDEDGLPLRDAESNIMYAYFSVDGYRTLKVEAWDDLGTYNYVTRRVLVDNYPPFPTAQATVAPRQSREVQASWDAAADGTDPAAAYNLRLLREPKTPSVIASWTVVERAVTGGATSTTFVATPFSRYKLEVQSESVLGHLESPAVWVSSETTTTAPELTGSYSRSVTVPKSKQYKVTYAINLSLTPPTFLASGQVVYEIWRSTNPATLGTGAPYRTVYDTTTPTDTITDGVTYVPGNTSPDWYYKIRATFVPNTESTKQYSVWSNVVKAPGMSFSNSTKAGTTTGQLEVSW